MIRKDIYIRLGLLILAILLYSCKKENVLDNNTKPTERKNAIDLLSIKENCCPDKRTSIFEVSIEKNILQGETSDKKAFEQLSTFAKNKELKNLVTLLPSKELVAEFGLISVSVAHLRGEAKHSSELVSQGLLGHPIKILKKENNWYKVQLVDGYLGWMDKKSFVFTPSPEKERWENGKKSFILDKNAALLNMQGELIYELVAGNIVLQEDGNNSKIVTLPDGTRGELQNTSLLDISKWASFSFSGSKIVSDTKEYLGIPYLWGGASPKGYDCSGLTKTVFLLNGIQLPRDASQQVLCGEEVTPGNRFDNLKAGDLLFFGKKATDTKQEKVSHVAIYMEKGEMIHATGHVRIQSLWEESPLFAEDRLKTFLRAKRITEDCIGSFDHSL